ncbi:MAG: PEP-CTERM sorting domain-containing protein [Proteobacteria bacterium]|nr:PEP-CTERM sorting domain-containing protein [Pseudomonadota bacterium]
MKTSPIAGHARNHGLRSTMLSAGLAGSLGLLALAASAPAQAAQVFNFSGACIDCSGDGVGTLTLADGAHGALTKTDFVSFSYRSNLVSFDISSADIVAVVGSLDPNNLGATYIDIVQLGGTGWEFTRNDDGSWSVSSEITHGTTGQGGGGGGGGFSAPGPIGLGGDSSDTQRVVNDFGADSEFSLASAAPEPAAWMLMILGFGGMGASLRRRRPGPAAIETA